MREAAKVGLLAVLVVTVDGPSQDEHLRVLHARDGSGLVARFSDRRHPPVPVNASIAPGTTSSAPVRRFATADFLSL